MSLSAGARLGPYEVLGPLGSGGMGEVYRARDTRLSREVAIKVLPAEVAGDPGRLRRFEKEARAASALNHPNIVTIYEIGSADSLSYIAMERIEGKTLREVLFAGSLSVKKAVVIAAQIADGLARAHEAGIVHRDLKPENVMVTRDGLVKILDFGLAKRTETGAGGDQGSRTPTETGTTPGAVLGTVGYMSPEQAAGQPVDFRSDQFSFGSILYEMVTGRRAFQKKTGVDTLGAILNDEPEPVVQITPQAPAPLAWIVDRCLAKEPRQRYSSSDDLARDLSTLSERLADVLPSRTPPALRPAFPAWAVVGGALLASALAGLFAGKLAWTGSPASPSFHRLTFRRGLLQNARFTPDGRTVVYSATWEGGGHDVYLTQVGSTESRLLLENADLFDVSPSGELAVMIPAGPRGTLARMALTGGAPRSVASDISWGDASWSPDGKGFAIVRSLGGLHRLEYPIGRVLYESRDPIGAPRVSPGGDMIAFYESGRSWSIALLDVESKQKRVLSAGWDKLRGGMPAWTHDGKEVWFTAAEPGQVESLWAVGLSGRTRLVTRVPGILELFDIARDRRILVGHHFLLSNLMCLAPGEANERDLSWLSDSRAGDLSIDGKTIVISEEQEGGGPAGTVYLRKTDGSPAIRLGEGVGAGLSPDGVWVIALVPAIGDKNAQLTLLPTGAGEMRTLIDGGFERFFRAGWLPDGKGIVFTGVEPGHAERVYLLDVSSGRFRAITPEEVSVRPIGSLLSPDGKLLLAARGNETFLWPLSGPAPTPLAGLSRGDVPVQFSADGRSLFVFRYRRAPPGIWLLDLRTGKWRVWRELQQPSGPPPTSLFVTPDGKSYVHGYRAGVSTLYTIEGLR